LAELLICPKKIKRFAGGLFFISSLNFVVRLGNEKLLEMLLKLICISKTRRANKKTVPRNQN